MSPVIVRYCLMAWVLPAVLVSAGCGWVDRLKGLVTREEHGNAAVQVGETVYTQSDLRAFFDSRLKDFRSVADADRVKSELLEAFIDEKLLLVKARELNVNPDPEVVRGMLDKISYAESELPDPAEKDPGLERLVEESLTVQQYLHDHLLNAVTVTEEESQEYYRDRIKEFVQNDVFHLREILLDDRALAERVLKSLKDNRNKNFAELARVHSKAPSASDGGDMGIFQRGDLPQEFEKAIIPLLPGGVSKIVQTRYGFHIFLMEERIPAHQQKYYEVKDQIQDRLRLEREREAVRAEMQSLREKIPVRIHRENLDFKYLGSRYSSAGGVEP